MLPAPSIGRGSDSVVEPQYLLTFWFLDSRLAETAQPKLEGMTRRTRTNDKEECQEGMTRTNDKNE